MNDKVKAAYIIAIGGIIVALIYVLSPKILNISIGSPTTIGPSGPPNTGITQPPSTVGPAPSCSGYQATGVDNTATYSVNVPSGCDMIVQAVVGQGVGSYNWNNGGVVAVGPGSYNITLTSGSYLITSDASAPKAFCDAVAYVQQGHPDGFGNYPLSGWASC